MHACSAIDHVCFAPMHACSAPDHVCFSSSKLALVPITSALVQASLHEAIHYVIEADYVKPDLDTRLRNRDQVVIDAHHFLFANFQGSF